MNHVYSYLIPIPQARPLPLVHQSYACCARKWEEGRLAMTNSMLMLSLSPSLSLCLSLSLSLSLSPSLSLPLSLSLSLSLSLPPSLSLSLSLSLSGFACHYNSMEISMSTPWPSIDCHSWNDFTSFCDKQKSSTYLNIWALSFWKSDQRWPSGRLSRLAETLRPASSRWKHFQQTMALVPPASLSRELDFPEDEKLRGID